MNNYFPSLTVLVPAYNNTDCLIRALESISSQTIAKKIFVTISDDCSPNKIAKDRVFAFEKYFSGLNFFRQINNLGVLSNKEWLFNTVETDFYTFLEHDDYVYRKDFYEKVLNKFIENEKLVCYFGNSVNIGSNQQKVINYKKEIETRKKSYDVKNKKLVGIKSDLTIYGEDFNFNLLNFTEIFNTSWSSIIFKTSTSKIVGGLGGNYTLSLSEASMLKVFREEEHFVILLLLGNLGEFQLEENPSIIRITEPTSYSISPTHPGITLIQDSSLFALYKAAFYIEQKFGAEKTKNTLKNIYFKIGKIALIKEDKFVKNFLKTYRVKDKYLSNFSKVSLKKSRKIQSSLSVVTSYIFRYIDGKIRLLKSKVRKLLIKFRKYI